MTSQDTTSPKGDSNDPYSKLKRARRSRKTPLPRKGIETKANQESVEEMAVARHHFPERGLKHALDSLASP